MDISNRFPSELYKRSEPQEASIKRIPPPRHLLLQAPVTEMGETSRNRYLFLFNDLLLICDPATDETANQRPGQDTFFEVKSLVGLNRATLCLPCQSPMAKIHPIVLMALHKFNTNAPLAIGYLVQKRVLTSDPLSIANFLFRTPDLSRRQLGLYLAQNVEIYDPFLDCLRLAHLGLDEAFRVLLSTLCLPEPWETLEPLIVRFAKKWHNANQNVIGFDREMVLKVVMAALFLNSEIWYGFSDVFGTARNIVQVPGTPTLETFLDRWREYDPYSLVPHRLIEHIYRSVCAERLETELDTIGLMDLSTTITMTSLPSRLTCDVFSDPIVISIPSPDTGLQILLRGQDLVFEPAHLDFSHNSSQSFRVFGRVPGKTMFMIMKRGDRSGRYLSPSSCRAIPIEVDTHYTLDLAIDPQTRYTFNLESLQEYVEWQECLRRICGSIGEACRPTSVSIETQAALKVLKDALCSSQDGTNKDKDTPVVTRRGQDIISMTVQNSLIPFALSFLRNCMQ